MIPAVRPKNPRFGSGPTRKRPGWSLDALADAALGRSHRSTVGKAKLKAVIDRTAGMLDLPEGYRLGIVPASDTGAFEMAMWSMLGTRPVDVLAFESFGKGWLTDAAKQLKLQDLRSLEADYGAIPDLDQVDCDRDVLFTWNGTTSGACMPDGSWISGDRAGLTFCDATSAVFAMALPWAKLDVVTWSWQKVMGGEAQHGMLLLSPRAVERLCSYAPPWPLPKIFRLTKGGALIEGIFRGETINTPSMLAVEDALDGLNWAEQHGGEAGLIERSRANLAVVEAWVAQTDWVEFLVADPAIRSSSSICLRLSDKARTGLDDDAVRAKVKAMTRSLEREGVAFDIDAYRDAPPGLRIWGGATVERDDIAALMPWLDWAYDTADA